MQNKTRFVRATIVAFTMLAMVIGSVPIASANSNELQKGTVFKGRRHSTLYYLDDDNRRLVFPNEGTYMSWYDDFKNVVEVDDDELAKYQLAGNVRYRPGSFLVKVQTDPKVYAVGENGLLRWIKTEALARELYGDNWNKLIDDIPVAFFINYQIGDLVDEVSDFDPVLAQEIETISENLRAKIQEQIQQKIEEKIADQRLRYCRKLEKHLAKLQKRLAKWDLEMESFNDSFMGRCLNNGDTDDDEEPVDTTAPIISGITATPSTTSSVINWITDESSTSVVEYATSSISTASSTKIVSSSTQVTSHSLTINNLESETMYYYIVKSKDAAGNLATSTQMSFITQAIVVPDTTAPVITNIIATPSSTTALITWITDETANSRVEYADESLSLATSTLELTNSAFVTNHSLELTGLTASTTYYFIVESADAAANKATSTEQSFTIL